MIKFVACQLALTREEVQEGQKNPERFLQELLNLVGYEGVIANPLIAPKEALGIINADIIQKFYHMTHVALAFEVPGDWLQERDGTIMAVIQVVWAAADAGLSLADVAAEAKHASEAVGTMGVALLVCTLPGQVTSDCLGPEKIELGLGIEL